jgi:hypothetical protein
LFFWPLNVAAEQAAENAGYFVIRSETRNLSSMEGQRKRDSSARSVPRNDKSVSFSAAREAATHKDH